MANFAIYLNTLSHSAVPVIAAVTVLCAVFALLVTFLNRNGS